MSLRKYAGAGALGIALAACGPVSHEVSVGNKIYEYKEPHAVRDLKRGVKIQYQDGAPGNNPYGTVDFVLVENLSDRRIIDRILVLDRVLKEGAAGSLPMYTGTKVYMRNEPEAQELQKEFDEAKKVCK